jgi:nucleotide-binding universal stress UspA family protein
MPGFVRSRVLVPIEFHESCGDALKVASSIADNPAHIYAIHVTSGSERDALQRLEAFLAEHGLAAARPQIASGDPAAQIVRHAERVGAELIVIPSRKGKVARMIMGSVAEAVARSAPCAVLVLRG